MMVLITRPGDIWQMTDVKYAFSGTPIQLETQDLYVNLAKMVYQDVNEWSHPHSTTYAISVDIRSTSKDMTRPHNFFD